MTLRRFLIFGAMLVSVAAVWADWRPISYPPLPGISVPFPQAAQPYSPYPTMHPVSYPSVPPLPPNNVIPPPLPSTPVPGIPASGWTLTVAEDGKLRVQTADGLSASVERMTMPVAGAQPLQVSVENRQVIVAWCFDCKSGCVKGADCLDGVAERVTRTGGDGSVLVLEGKAKLLCMRKGKKAEIAADRILVNVTTGHIETELSWQQALPQVTPPPPGIVPVTPTCPQGPATRSSTPSRDDGTSLTKLIGSLR
jgi:hypothetical protein